MYLATLLLAATVTICAAMSEIISEDKSLKEVHKIVEVEEPRKPTKKELKAVEKFNAVVDNIAKILSQRLSESDALPLEVDGEVLEELEREVTILPPTTTSTTTAAPGAPVTPVEPAEPVCPERWVTKCLTTNCQGKQKCLKKCKAKGCALEKNRKKKKGNNNKKNKIKGDDKKKHNKKNIKNDKNENNKNNRKNKIKTIRNKIFRNRAGSNRQSKGLDFDDLDDLDDLDEVVQGRRKGDDTTTEKTNDTPKKGNRNNKNKNKNKNNDTPKKGNKNNKNNNKNRSEDLEAEAKDDYVPKSAEVGPLFATSDELFASSAVLTGFSNIRREGDVIVDLSGKHAKFTATVVISPLTVLLTNPASSLRRSEVTTELRAKMLFTAKEPRRRDKLNINEVVVEVPEYESVSVLRSDLDLEPEVISAAQEGVSSAIDTCRVARIIHQTLAAAFNEDNILKNLEDHPSLMAKA